MDAIVLAEHLLKDIRQRKKDFEPIGDGVDDELAAKDDAGSRYLRQGDDAGRDHSDKGCNRHRATTTAWR